MGAAAVTLRWMWVSETAAGQGSGGSAPLGCVGEGSLDGTGGKGVMVELAGTMPWIWVDVVKGWGC